MILLIPATNLLLSSGTISDTVQNRATATYLATQEIDAIRQQAYSTGSGDGAAFWANVDARLGPSGPITLSVQESRTGGIAYTATNTLQWVGQGENVNECGVSGNSPPQLLQVRSSVAWPGPGSGGAASAVTDLAPPPGVFSSNTTGNLGVAVKGASGQPMVGIPVTVTEAGGSDSQTQKTASDGCAFFAFLPTAHSWDISAAAPGDVSNQEATAATLTQVSLADGTTTDETLLLDQGANVDVSLPTGSTPVAGGMTYSVASPQLPTGFYSFPAQSTTPATAGPASGTTSLGPLFPYTSGYVVFAGSCTDSNPAGAQGNASGQSFYDTPATPTLVDPGGTASATVGLGDLAVAVTANGSAAAGATITATPITPTNAPFGSNIDWTCNGAPTYNLANTDATGTSVTEVPYGHYMVEVTYGGTTKTAYVWVALPWSNEAVSPSVNESAGEYALSSTTGLPATNPAPGPITVAF